MKKINIEGPVRTNESMKLHTSFRIGGPADIYAQPSGLEDLSGLLSLARAENVPVFILGGGANILVADRGIRGMVIDMSSFSRIRKESDRIIAGCGTAVSMISEKAAEAGLTGLEFVYKMPGSLGGALWMNARCYGRSIGDTSGWVEFLDRDLQQRKIDLVPDDFGYKRSPFQGNGAILIQAGFQLEKGDPDLIFEKMREIETDRKAKGHFQYPSAGSVFKNNRAFGAPTGVILDKLGLKGLRHGGAQIAPFHANIIINTGDATADDVDHLISHAQELAYRSRGIRLEPELRFVGEWRKGRNA